MPNRKLRIAAIRAAPVITAALAWLTRAAPVVEAGYRYP